MKSLFPLIILFLLAINVGNAQDISGVWKGDFSGGFLNGGLQELVVELSMHNDSLIEGKSHLYYSGNRFEHYKIHGVFHRHDSTVYFSEYEEIRISLGILDNVMGGYDMKLSYQDGNMRLDGKWKENGKKGYAMLNSKVWLEKSIPKTAIKQAGREKRVDKPADTLVKKAIPEKITQDPQRNYKVQGTMTLSADETDSIHVEILDNADVDGDIVSLYIDESIVIDKQMITDKPIALDLLLNKQTNQLRMVAISEGKISPCTAHIIITTKHHRHEQDLWSNSVNTGVIELKVEQK